MEEREEEGGKGGGSLLLLEKPTSPARPVVISTCEDGRAMTRHARRIPAVPGVVVIGVSCNIAREVDERETATQGSIAVVAFGHSAERASVGWRGTPA